VKPVTIPGLVALAGGLAAASFLGAGCNLQWSPYAAKVGTTVITPAQLDDDLHQASSNTMFRCLLGRSNATGSRLNGAGTSTYDSTFVSYVLTNLIDSDVAHSVASTAGISESVAARALARSQVDRAFASELSSTQCGPATTDLLSSLGTSLASSFVQLQLDEDALAARDAHISLTAAGVTAYERSHAAATRESCISGLFVKTKSGAHLAERALRSGESLMTVVTKYAPSQIASKGALGCYTSSQLSGISTTIEKPVAAARIGATLAPVLYQGAYLVLQVTSRPYEPVVAALDQIFTTYAPSFSKAIRSAVERAHVQVNPQYGRWTTAAAGSGAVATGFGGRVEPNAAPAAGDLLNGSAVRAKATSTASSGLPTSDTAPAGNGPG
jgi:hypothetical protein